MDSPTASDGLVDDFTLDAFTSTPAAAAAAPATANNRGSGVMSKMLSKTTEVLSDAKTKVVSAAASSMKGSGSSSHHHHSDNGTPAGSASASPALGPTSYESDSDSSSLLLGMDLEDHASPSEMKDMFEQGAIVIRKVQLYEIIRPAIEIMKEKAAFNPANKGSNKVKKDPVLKFLLVGTDKSGSMCKLLRVFKLGKKLRFEEDAQQFTSVELRKVLTKFDKDLSTKNSSLKLLCRGDGFAGMLKLIYGYFFVMIEKVERVAVIAGRELFAVKKFAFFPAYDDPPQAAVEQPELNVDAQYIQILDKNLDVDRQMFCSYAYDLTSSFQGNASSSGAGSGQTYSYMYTFNYYLANRFLSFVQPPHRSNFSRWVVPVIQGFVGQRKCVTMAADKVSKKELTVTLIARRSRHFTGTRYNRRGMMMNPGAYVANEVESELIIASGFPWVNAASSKVVSVQFIRGSIPLFWTQINPLSPHPEIQVYKREEDLKTTKAHFDRLMKTYKGGIVVLNLIKQVDKAKKRDNDTGAPIKLSIPSLGETGEPMIGAELQLAIETLKANHFKKSIDYQAYDFHFQRKARANYLGEIVECVKKQCSKIGFFSFDPQNDAGSSQQHGVVRVNCIDCLDRTNVGQYCVVRAVLPKVVKFFDLKCNDEDMLSTEEDMDLDELQPELVNAVKSLFKKHGDAISMQYAGSEAMHSDPLNVRRSSLSSESKDVPPSPNRSPSPNPNPRSGENQVVSSISNAFKAVKRYYANNVSDSDRQNAYDIFLGTFIPSKENGYLIWNSEKKKEAQAETVPGHCQDVDKELDGMDTTFRKVSSMRLGILQSAENDDEKVLDETEDANQEEEEEDEDQEVEKILERAPSTEETSPDPKEVNSTSFIDDLLDISSNQASGQRSLKDHSSGGSKDEDPFWNFL
eukprot:TRINITY_DN8809_c0_g1_i1.p1 TRINITY_DN8809_c0_g1~~TRINITY_DN8809_c0_g1_i1.p1  ORF type:complete len:913 (-),score=258.14 TRINITY_DN8809_c0_g1_i1:95-2833(-)